MKIVVLDGYTLNPGDLSWEPLYQFGDVTIYDRTPSSELLERLKDCEIVYTNKTVLDRSTLFANPQIKFIGVLATGYNVVDIDAACELGITVCNVPAYGTDSVAQFVFALLLALCHRVEMHSNTVMAGEWTRCPDFCYWHGNLVELSGKTMGLIGFGRIAMRTAQIALAFGMEVVAYHHRAVPGSQSTAVPGVKMVDFETLLACADVVSLHVPLVEPSRAEVGGGSGDGSGSGVCGPSATRHIINSKSLAAMKDGAMLINTGRGPLIDELALATALKSGKLSGAALDVVSQEPISSDNPLLNAPNCLITPHIAWAPREARTRLMAIAIENLEMFLAQTPQNVILGTGLTATR